MSSKRKVELFSAVDVVNPHVLEQTSFCILWNVVLWPDKVQRAWDSCRDHCLGEVLGLGDGFPVDLLQASLLDVRFVGVPLKPGVCAAHRVYDCFGISLLVIKHRLSLPDVSYCQASKSEKQRGCCKCLVYCVRKTHRRLLKHLPYEHALTLWDIFRTCYTRSIVKDIAEAASMHEAYVRKYCAEKKLDVKSFKNEVLLRCSMTREISERLRLNSIESSPLGFCPVQLGWTQEAEWRGSCDVCRRDKKQDFVDLLSERCRAGLVSLQVVRKPAYHTPPMVWNEWTLVIMHTLKEQMMQKFLSAGFLTVFRGSVDTSEKERNIVSRYSNFELAPIPKNLSLCMAFLIPASEVEGVLQKFQEGYQRTVASDERDSRRRKVEGGRFAFVQNIPWNEVYALGQFNVCRQWIDINQQALKFQRTIVLTGDVYVFVGEYAGPAVHIVAALQRTRGSSPPACTKALMSLHAPDVRSADLGVDSCTDMKLEDIQERCSALQYELSSDQIRLCETILKKHVRGQTAFIPVSAVPGASKTFIGSMYACSFAERLKDFEAVVWLVPSRQQRCYILKLLRSRLAAGVLAGSMGRASEAESSMEEDGEWQLDSETQAFMDDRIRHLIGPAEKTAAWLSKNTGVQPGDRDFAFWKMNNVHLHTLSVQIYDERNAAWRALFEKIKIWCLTVDGFLQILSGKSYLSRHFECVKVQLAIGDEFHQMEIEKMYTISHFVGSCICLYDDAQRIVFFKYGDRLADEAKNDDNSEEYWNWQRSVTGGASLSLHAACAPEFIVTMPYCWRFSGKLVKFLNKTSVQYGEKGCPILSPLDHADDFTPSALARIPDTRIRFVHYANSLVYLILERGLLQTSPCHMVNLLNERSARSTTKNIGASLDVFVNLLHEGLSFLHCLYHNELRWNEKEMAKFSAKEPQVLTIIYLHMVREVFEQYKRVCLDDDSILNAFGLDPSIDYNAIWVVTTPEVASGESVKLVQIAVVQENLFGNHRCSGRRNVCYSRAQLFLSTHMLSECFDHGELPDVWKKHFEELRGNKYSVTDVECADGIVGCAVAESWFGFRCNIWSSWHALVNFSADLPGLVQRGRDMFGSSFSMERHLGSSSRMSFAQSLASVCAVKNPTKLEPSDDDIDAINRESFLYDWQTLTDSRGLILNPPLFYEMLPKLLPSVGYYFTPTSAQVVPLLVEGAMNSSGYAPESVIAAIIEFGRVLALQAMTLCANKSLFPLFPGKIMVGALVPHKRQILNMQVLRQCKSLREAFVVIAEDDKDKMSSPYLYTYLGGGVPHQPPQGYGLVFRGLSHDVADCLCALVSVYTETAPDYRLIVPKKAMDPKAREDAVNLRIEKIESIRKELYHEFSSRGLPWPCDLCKKMKDNYCKLCGEKHVITCEDNVENSACPFKQLAHGLAELGFDAVLSDIEG